MEPGNKKIICYLCDHKHTKLTNNEATWILTQMKLCTGHKAELEAKTFKPKVDREPGEDDK